MKIFKIYTLSIITLIAFVSQSNAQIILEYDIKVPYGGISIYLSGKVDVVINFNNEYQNTYKSESMVNYNFYRPGIKRVIITGTLNGFQVGPQLTKVISWEGVGLTTFNYAFFGAYDLIEVPDSLPKGITNLSNMFWGASKFNYPIGNWDVSEVTDMSNMFIDAKSFNQPINNWQTSKVANMQGMFIRASSFNMPIGSWNTSSVTDMSIMFLEASSFNQAIGKWNITNVRNMDGMFGLAALCTDNYDNLLNGWASQAVKTGVLFDGGDSKYSNESEKARELLTEKAWSMSDAGLGNTIDTKCIITNVDRTLAHAKNKIVAYPIPAKDNISFKGLNAEEIYSTNIFTLENQLIKKVNLKGNESLFVGDLHTGTYIVQVMSGGKSNTILVAIE